MGAREENTWKSESPWRRGPQWELSWHFANVIMELEKQYRDIGQDKSARERRHNDLKDTPGSMNVQGREQLIVCREKSRDQKYSSSVQSRTLFPEQETFKPSF